MTRSVPTQIYINKSYVKRVRVCSVGEAKQAHFHANKDRIEHYDLSTCNTYSLRTSSISWQNFDIDCYSFSSRVIFVMRRFVFFIRAHKRNTRNNWWPKKNVGKMKKSYEKKQNVANFYQWIVEKVPSINRIAFRLLSDTLQPIESHTSIYSSLYSLRIQQFNGNITMSMRSISVYFFLVSFYAFMSFTVALFCVT